MGIMLEEFEADYRKREIRRYEELIITGREMIDVPVHSVVKMLLENLSYRNRIGYLMELIMRQNSFLQPQRKTLCRHDSVRDVRLNSTLWVAKHWHNRKPPNLSWGLFSFKLCGASHGWCRVKHEEGGVPASPRTCIL